jgi:hypothetical protein
MIEAGRHGPPVGQPLAIGATDRAGSALGIIDA